MSGSQTILDYDRGADPCSQSLQIDDRPFSPHYPFSPMKCSSPRSPAAMAAGRRTCWRTGTQILAHQHFPGSLENRRTPWTTRFRPCSAPCIHAQRRGTGRMHLGLPGGRFARGANQLAHPIEDEFGEEWLRGGEAARPSPRPGRKRHRPQGVYKPWQAPGLSADLPPLSRFLSTHPPFAHREGCEARHK